MSLEPVTYISDLNPENPGGDDSKNQGDDHLKNIKKGLRNTFPNINAPVTPTPAELNRLVGVTADVQTQLNALNAAKVNRAGDTVTGPLALTPVAASVSLMLNKPAGAYANGVIGTTGSVLRWAMSLGDSTSEAGSNAGSDFILGRYNDAGGLLAVAMRIARATGLVEVAGPMTIGGSLGVVGAMTVAGATVVPYPSAPTHAATQQFVIDYVAGAVGGGAKLLRSARSSNANLTAADTGTLIDITSGTFTQTFAAAGSLANGWWIYYRNSGTGVITLDPNGAELIDGQPTKVVYPGDVYLIQGDATALYSSLVSSRERLRAIFDPQTLTMSPATEFNGLENLPVVPYNGTLSISGLNAIVSNGSVFVGGAGTGTTSVPTSPDGRTWTLRTAPSSAAWTPTTDGSGFMLFSSTTATAYSAAGVTFAAATVLPAATSSSGAGIPGRWGKVTSTLTTVYISTDNGTTWTTETVPVNASKFFGLYNAATPLFVTNNNANAYYTSPTGTTGSWTLRALPTGCGDILQQADGSLTTFNPTTFAVYRSTDGINWVAASYSLPIGTSSNNVRTVNGIPLLFPSTTQALSWHNGRWMRRSYTGVAGHAGNQIAKVGNVHLLAPNSGAVGASTVNCSIYLIDHTAADAALGLFGA